MPGGVQSAEHLTVPRPPNRREQLMTIVHPSGSRRASSGVAWRASVVRDA